MAKYTDKKRKYICEELEPRILLSAGVEGLVYDSTWEPDATLEAETDAAQIVALFNSSQTATSSELTTEIVFIDSSLPDSESLISDLLDNNDSNRQFEIVLLNEEDGISQITSYLQSQENIDAIHFITHGEEGQIQLGNDLLDLNNIDSYSSDFLLWQNSLDEDADILFYGCDVASSDDGLSLIQKISSLTDADVAASDDITGNSQLGGDWELEKNIGSIETSIVVSTELQDGWKVILPTVSFQEGVDGYFGTVDTQIDELTPTVSYSDDNDISIDGGTNEKQGLIRFESIFSDNGGIIPSGSTITSATLTFYVTDPSLNSASIELYTINDSLAWDDTSTWGSLGNGITIGIEAASVADSELADPGGEFSQTFTGLETTLQSWSDGGTNNGWVITNDKTDGWGFTQSDNDAPFTSNPVLTVTYTANTAPVIDSVTGTFTGVENASTLVATAAVSDVDTGDTLTYSLAPIVVGDTDVTFFSINASGDITFNATDFDIPQDDDGNNSYDFQVVVTDALGATDTQNISVSLTNANEAPVIDSVTGTFTGVENASTLVATAAVSDVDTGDTLTYSLAPIVVGDTDVTFFSINASGDITFNATDFDIPQDDDGNNSYDFQVVVTDALGATDTQNISVSLTNANEAPVIDSVTGTFTGVENASTLVATAAVSDVDTGDTLTYSLAPIVVGDTDVTFFSINASGDITFNATDFDIPQDDDGNNSYDFQVVVTDALGATDTQNISVSLTNANEAPVIDSVTGTFTGVENASTLVATAAVSDVDTGDTLTYSLAPIVVGDTDVTFFSINASGDITFNATDFDIPQDDDGNNSYDFQVVVTDALGATDTQNISVSLTNANEAPVIDSVTGTFTGVENASTLVATAAVSDVDTGDTLTYSLAPIVVGDTDVTFFSINASGDITFNATDFDIPQDDDGNNSYDFQVVVTDALGATDTQNISVSLTNANEAPVIDSVTGTFTGVENASTLVATAAVSDVDTGDTLTYSLAPIVVGDTDVTFFSINASGDITFNATDFDIPQDDDGNNSYDFQVVVTDALGATDTQNISVSLTNANEAPVIDSVTGTFTGVENASTLVATAAVSDVDTGDTLTYSLAPIVVGDTDVTFFSINASGDITFNATDFDIPQDDDGNNSYDFQVVVTDALGATDTQNISVSLTNANEAPVLNPIGNPSVLENSTGIIATAIATDVDAGDVLTYTLNGVDAALFSIDSVTGTISFTAPDFENPLDNGGNNVYDIQVIATDLMGLTASQNIMVTVVDVNEAPTSTDQQFSINGGSVNGSLVGGVIASDLDTGDTLAYTVIGGTGLGDFSIDSASGQITVTNSSALESNVAKIYTLSVLVTDSSGNTSTSTVTISVSPTLITNPVLITPPPVETNTSPVRVDTAGETTLNHSGYSFHSHIILTHTDPANSGQSSGDNGVDNDADARDVKADWLSSSKNVFGSEYLSYRSGGAFYDALDRMNHDIDESAETRENSIFSAGIRGTGIALTAGIASWVLRGSSLLASFLSTIPVWRGLDPLPILAAARKKQKKDVNVAKSRKNNSDTDTDDVDDIFEENNNTPKKPTQDV